jgi:hypothetical protein
MRLVVALSVASLAPRLLWWLPGGPREHHLLLVSMALSVAVAAWLWRLETRFLHEAA